MLCLGDGEMCRPLHECSVKLGMNSHSGQSHVEFFTDIRAYGSGGVRKIMGCLVQYPK